MKWTKLLNALIWTGWGILSTFHLLTIDTLPPGLHYDEAYNVLDVVRFGQDGFWPVFLSGNFGREALMQYFMALSLKLFGPEIWAVRLPVALAWIASFPALYWLLRELYPSDEKGRTVRWLIAAPLSLTCLWFAVTAHNGIRISWLVLFGTLFLAALWRAWRTGSFRTAILAGVLGGLSLYTYLPSRLLPPLLIAMLALGLILRRQVVRARWKVLAVATITSLVVAAPLLLYFVANPDHFFLRASQVAITPANPNIAADPLAVLGQNAANVAGMFFGKGDDSPRSNLVERPVFTLAVLPLFLLGLLVSLDWRRGLRGVFTLLWFLIMLQATVLSDYAPSFQRAIGAFPPTILLVAEGGYAIWSAASGRLAEQRIRYRRIAMAALAVALAAVVSWESGTGLLAFCYWSRQPALFSASDGGLAVVGRYLATLPLGTRLYISPLSNPVSMAFYLLKGPVRPLRSFDGRHTIVLRPGEDVTYAVLVQEDARSATTLPSLFPGAALRPSTQLVDADGKPFADIYRAPAAVRPRAPQFAADARWNDGIALAGYDLTPCCSFKPGDVFSLQLWWQASATPKTDWTVFTHLLNPSGAWSAGQDGQPGGGSYRTSVWETGDIVVDEYQITVPATAAPGQYTLEIGLYQWPSGARLGLAGSAGSSLTLRPLTVQ